MKKFKNGFFISDLLLSIAAWIIIAGIFLPFVAHLQIDALNRKYEEQAIKILYESLQTSVIRKTAGETTVIEKTGKPYLLTWNGEEVCVSYEDFSQKARKFCDIWR
ncbi:hypothetical protein J9303_16860 [Bacillaceae bacterium Marseille-Q3522]|nr:hypothetical protein [Bacillaceae bacterium Marseille-Q3522]